MPSAWWEAANTTFKVFSMTRPGVKPYSPGYQADALNRYTKRWFIQLVARAHISEWFYTNFFVYSITTILLHSEIDVRNCIKSKPRAASNTDPLRRSPAY